MSALIRSLDDTRPSKLTNESISKTGTSRATMLVLEVSTLIGAGLSLIEVQQNLDLTYRLYDYGRPRELHLDEGVAVADPTPYDFAFTPYDRGAGRQIAEGFDVGFALLFEVVEGILGVHVFVEIEMLLSVIGFESATSTFESSRRNAK